MNEKENDTNAGLNLGKTNSEQAEGDRLEASREESDAAREEGDRQETAETPEAESVRAEEREALDEPLDADERQEEEDDNDRNDPADAAASGADKRRPAGNNGRPWMYVAIGLAILLAVALIKPPFAGVSGNDAVAEVNGVKIDKDDLYNKLVELGGKSTLDQMVQEELIKQEADKAGITTGEADIDSEMDLWKNRFGSEDEFNSWLQSQGMTLADFRKEMPTQLRIRKLLEPKTTVTDDQIKDFFEQNKAQFDTPEQVRASHILVATKEEADDILKQLKDGADFAKLASEKSTDTGTKDQGGDLNFFTKDQMDPDFADAAFALKNPGDLSPVVQSSYGYHIIKLTDRKPAHAATLEENKDKIKDQLVAQQISQLSQSWLADIQAKAKITNTLDEPAEDAGTPAASEVPDEAAAPDGAAAQ